MKKFVRQIVVFIVPIIIVASIGDILFSHILRNDKVHITGKYNVWNDIYCGNINADCLIYGSSRAYEHFDSYLIEKETGLSVYNLGMDAQNFYLQKLMHEEYIKFNKKPRYIIYSLDLGTLHRKNELIDKEQYYPFMFGNKNMQKYLSYYDGINVYDFYIPILRYIGSPKVLRDIAYDIFNPSIQNNPYRKKGYRGMDAEWNIESDKIRNKMQPYRLQIEKDDLNTFELFLRECSENKSKCIFVYSPHYIEGQQLVLNKDSILNIYHELSEKYNVPFFDYSKDSLSYNKKYFYNSSHLNIEASRLFTKILIEDLEKYDILK